MFYQHYMDSIKAQDYHLDSKTEIFRDAKGGAKVFQRGIPGLGRSPEERGY